MAESRIPVDLFNPGQVFACLGFLEAAEVLLGEAEGGFDWSEPEDVRFVLRARGDAEPVGAVLEFLAGAKVSAITPAGSKLDIAKWEVPAVCAPGDEFPFPEPDSPATLPALLEGANGRCLTIEHWGDATRRDAVKFWGGGQGLPRRRAGTRCARSCPRRSPDRRYRHLRPGGAPDQQLPLRLAAGLRAAGGGVFAQPA
jgi:CRISPR-associated protein Csx14